MPYLISLQFLILLGRLEGLSFWLVQISYTRCCAHILNLIVKDGLEIIKGAIENFRDSVAYWTATP